MMDFIMRFYKKYKFKLIFFLWFALQMQPVVVLAEGVEVRLASLQVTDDRYALDADIDIQLTSSLEDALQKGVALYFQLEFELVRGRWYWFNERAILFEQPFRLSYNAITRQYRIGIGAFYQNFEHLKDAIYVMSRVRRRAVLDSGPLNKSSNYQASIRLRLDVSRLPRPFNINAVGTKDWNLGSDWYRWQVNP